MPESLLSSSRVLLYGRVVEDLKIERPAPNPAPPAGPGANNFLRNQLAHNWNAPGKAQLARIYGFSYEGHYYDLATPALFLVHGNGDVADTPAADARAARAPESANKTGVAATAKSFSDDMMVWAYDKSDLSIRLNIETGTIEQILLETELSADRIKIQYAGQKARLRGDRGPGNED